MPDRCSVVAVYISATLIVFLLAAFAVSCALWEQRLVVRSEGTDAEEGQRDLRRCWKIVSDHASRDQEKTYRYNLCKPSQPSVTPGTHPAAPLPSDLRTTQATPINPSDTETRGRGKELTADFAILVTTVLGRSYSPIEEVVGPSAGVVSSVVGRLEGIGFLRLCVLYNVNESRTEVEG